MMRHMPAIPESTRSSIILRLLDHAEHNWPQLVKIRARYHGSFAYITGVLRDGEQIPLFRLRYGGSAHSFGFAIYSPARDRYETLSCSPACPSAARKKHSTPPAPSTSQDSDTNPNPDPRRTYGVTHLREQHSNGRRTGHEPSPGSVSCASAVTRHPQDPANPPAGSCGQGNNPGKPHRALASGRRGPARCILGRIRSGRRKRTCHIRARTDGKLRSSAVTHGQPARPPTSTHAA